MAKIETRELLGDTLGYERRIRSGLSMLSHACEVNERGAVVRVLCGRAKLSNLADRFACDSTAAPTCKNCLRKLRQMQFREAEAVTREGQE